MHGSCFFLIHTGPPIQITPSLAPWDVQFGVHMNSYAMTCTGLVKSLADWMEMKETGRTRRMLRTKGLLAVTIFSSSPGFITPEARDPRKSFLSINGSRKIVHVNCVKREGMLSDLHAKADQCPKEFAECPLVLQGMQGAKLSFRWTFPRIRFCPASGISLRSAVEWSDTLLSHHTAKQLGCSVRYHEGKRSDEVMTDIHYALFNENSSGLQTIAVLRLEF